MTTVQNIRDGLADGTVSATEFLEFMKTEGRKIDPRSADVRWWHAQVCDPYGLGCPEEYHCIGRTYFARALGSTVWVEFGDLPDETRRVLRERLQSGKPPVTVPFNFEVERMADAISKVYDPCNEHGRACALEAAQVALDALRDLAHADG